MSTDFVPMLEEKQVASFRADGFVALDRITGDDEIAWLREVYARILDDAKALKLRYGGETPAGGAAEITQIFVPELQCPELLQTGYIRNAQRLAASLLGVAAEAISYGGLMMIFKPAGAGLEAPFHQDEAYWEFPGERLSHSASCWMPLDDVTVDSGCMQFVPGSHALEVMKHRRKAPTEPLELDEPYDLSGAVACPLAPGGATFHHCRTVHGTGPNVSPRPRRAFTTIFHAPPGVREVRLSRPWLGLPLTAMRFDPGPPPQSDFTVRLDEAQIEAFHRDGFTHIARITTDEEIAWLGPLYDSLFATQRGAWRGGYFDLARPYESEGQDLVPQVLMPDHSFPQLRDTTLVRNAIAIGAQLLGVAEAELRTWSHMISKPPKVGGALPWHQDEAYWDTGFRYRALGCWMPLDPATVESGCMHFIPGSHRDGVRPHRHIGDDPSVHGLVTDGVDESRAVAVPLSPGGATFHHCRTLHMTPPNVSDHVRRAFANEVQLDPAPLAEGEDADRPWVRAGREAWKKRQIPRG